jgi:IS30 family transposase
VPGKRLTFEDREFIEAARRRRLSCREIARELGRPHSTVSREIQRNRQAGNGAYRCVVAEFRTRQRARRPKVFKLSRHPKLARSIEVLLVRKWSPEQISVRLRELHPDDPRWWVSPEAIYASLYVQGKGGLKAELVEHLKLKRSSRRVGNGPGQIPDRVHFSLRPADAKDRAVPGHWEGDLILGGRSSQVGMLAERTTRYCLFFALTDRSAETVRLALEQIIKTLPAHLKRSLTWDNGKELAQHKAFTLATDVQVYFCDPGHPWQRGTAENTIGLARAYLPKGADFTTLTQADLDEFAVMMNERPRKTLGWRSPAEAYAQLLNGAMTG